MHCEINLKETMEVIHQSKDFIFRLLNFKRLTTEVISLVSDNKINIANAHTLTRLPKEKQNQYIREAKVLGAYDFASIINIRVKNDIKN